MRSPRFQVFLSHGSADKPAVEELARRLKQEGIEPWLDKWNLIPGDPWQPAIEAALAGCAACAVFIGPGGFGVWQNEEMRAAVDRRVADGAGRFRVIPVLLPGVERPERSKLPTFLVATTWVEFRRSLDDQEAFRRLVCGIRGIEPGAEPDGASVEGVCPYRGLEVFDEEHHRFFYGREALTEWLVNKLRSAPAGQENRFLAILGASGSGKSSLARAGLVPALRQGGLDGSADWPITILRPGPDPLESLAVSLAAFGGAMASAVAIQDLMATLKDDERTLHQTVRLALRDVPASRRLVVLVDQFEEVFTLCSDERARKALIDNLLYAASTTAGQTLVVLTMRADFYGKCAAYPKLAEALSDHQVLVGPLTPEELRRAIERPAVLAGGELEPGLAELLIQDVEGQAGALPLMQFALRELWMRRAGRRMTRAAYREIGELQGALKNRADAILGSLSQAERELSRRIFLRLTQPGEGTEDTKRRASLAELVSARGDEETVRAVLQKLSAPDARLITIGPDGTSVEVAHEALIRSWPALRQWIEADRLGQRTLRRLTDAAREWDASARDPSFLYAGARLAVADEWAETHRDELSTLEADFLSQSRTRSANELEAARRRADELGQLAATRKRLAWRLGIVMVISLVLAAGAVAGVVLALKFYRDSKFSATQLEGNFVLLADLYAKVPTALSHLLAADDPTDAEQARRELKEILDKNDAWVGTKAVADKLEHLRDSFFAWKSDQMPPPGVLSSAIILAIAFKEEVQTGVLSQLEGGPQLFASARGKAYEEVKKTVESIRSSSDYLAVKAPRRKFWEYYWARLLFLESRDVEKKMVDVGNGLTEWGKRRGGPGEQEAKKDLNKKIDELLQQLGSEIK